MGTRLRGCDDFFTQAESREKIEFYINNIGIISNTW
jgi:hypothetical protein